MRIAIADDDICYRPPQQQLGVGSGVGTIASKRGDKILKAWARGSAYFAMDTWPVI